MQAPTSEGKKESSVLYFDMRAGASSSSQANFGDFLSVFWLVGVDASKLKLKPCSLLVLHFLVQYPLPLS